MVAYAAAGSMRITPPSGSLPRDVRGSDTAQHAPVPFDIVLASHFQVLAAAQKLPSFVALEWFTRQDDEQERGIWVSNSSRIPPGHGAIIWRVMEKRDQAWDPPEKGSIIINNTYIKGRQQG